MTNWELVKEEIETGNIYSNRDTETYVINKIKGYARTENIYEAIDWLTQEAENERDYKREAEIEELQDELEAESEDYKFNPEDDKPEQARKELLKVVNPKKPIINPANEVEKWLQALQMGADALSQPTYNRHEVACILAEAIGDTCACNVNGIDEWLPLKCDFAEKECPNVVGVACWEQYLKHKEESDN